MLRYVSALPALFLLAPTSGTAQVSAAPGNPAAIAVVVRIATPTGFTRDRVIELMRQTVPQYEALPGLMRKYYTISDDNAVGGIYLFRDRASAEKHFNPGCRHQKDVWCGRQRALLQLADSDRREGRASRALDVPADANPERVIDWLGRYALVVHDPFSTKHPGRDRSDISLTANAIIA